MSVFDTSAVLAIFYDEPGRDVAQTHLRGSSISMVNVAEVLGDLVLAGKGTPEVAMQLLDGLAFRYRRIHDLHVIRAAELHRVKNLSLGDRFCIALAEGIGEPLVTADRAWADLPLKVPVQLIR